MPFDDIHSELEAARAGHNPAVIARARSGWFVMASVQLLPGKCLLLPDPLVGSINDLARLDRTRFLSDMVGLGDALLRVTDAYRINYEILGNSDPVLHAHITPRYMSEPEHLRSGPAWLYDMATAPRFDLARDGPLLNRLARCLAELELIVEAPRST
jgi:diadenosine tetraphosphate (Ap4A) HIT family hydrolase